MATALAYALRAWPIQPDLDPFHEAAQPIPERVILQIDLQVADQRIAERAGDDHQKTKPLPYRGQSSFGSRRAGRACGDGAPRSAPRPPPSNSCAAGGIGGRVITGVRRTGSVGSG